MLVLSRRVGDKLMIDGNIQITIVTVNPDEYGVKLGFTAPQEIAIWRQELYDVIVEQQRLASGDCQGD